jgi:alpha-galactosidase
MPKVSKKMAYHASSLRTSSSFQALQFLVMIFLIMFTTIADSRHMKKRGRLPVMGWSGYNAFMQNSGHCDVAGASGYNETTFLETASVLVKTGLAKLGYIYINADDCWIAENRTKEGKLAADSSRFPHGMEYLANELHKQNLRLGLYAAASVETCRQFPGSQSYEEVDAATFSSWGADFVKLDSCGGVLPNGKESWVNQYSRWAVALTKSGRDIVFSCSWAVYFTICAAKYPRDEWVKECGAIPWENNTIANICNMWRYGDDLRPVWTMDNTRFPNPGSGNGGVGDVIEYASTVFANTYRSIEGPGALNDPDFLVVGCPTDRPCETTSGGGKTVLPLTDVEQRTQMSIWCIWGAPLIIGSDIRNLSKYALETLSNKHAININQDSLVATPKLLLKDLNGRQIWSRELENGDVAVALLNTGAESQIIKLSIQDIVCIGCKPVVRGIDVWNTEKGSTIYQDNIALMVDSHATILLRLSMMKEEAEMVKMFHSNSNKIGLVLALYNANVTTDWKIVADAASRIPIRAIVPVKGVSPPDPGWHPTYPSDELYRNGVNMLKNSKVEVYAYTHLRNLSKPCCECCGNLTQFSEWIKIIKSKADFDGIMMDVSSNTCNSSFSLVLSIYMYFLNANSNEPFKYILRPLQNLDAPWSAPNETPNGLNEMYIPAANMVRANNLGVWQNGPHISKDGKIEANASAWKKYIELSDFTTLFEMPLTKWINYKEVNFSKTLDWPSSKLGGYVLNIPDNPSASKKDIEIALRLAIQRGLKWLYPTIACQHRTGSCTYATLPTYFTELVSAIEEANKKIKS